MVRWKTCFLLVLPALLCIGCEEQLSGTKTDAAKRPTRPKIIVPTGTSKAPKDQPAITVDKDERQYPFRLPPAPPQPPAP